MPEYRLYYFANMHARASAIKCQLAHANADWEDIEVPGAEWSQHKPEFGAMPVVRLADNTLLKESIPTSRYLAKVFGQYPEDALAAQ